MVAFTFPARTAARQATCLGLLGCAGWLHAAQPAPAAWFPDAPAFLGALLAAQACGCSIRAGALACFGEDGASGGGIAATHASSADRMRQLLPFAESARRLANRMSR